MPVYLGKSWLIDFLACAGLGIAAACCLIALRGTINPMLDQLKAPALRSAMRLVGLGAFIGVELAIVVFIADTDGLRQPQSIFGYVLGIVLLVPALATLLRR
jgi:hypothetical protein